VPQFYLNYWSRDKKMIYRYDLLVPNDKVPIWKYVSIKGNAYFPDLYTSIQDGTENEEFERLVKQDYEDPAKPIFEKVIKDKSLKKSEIDILVRFLALQDIRTPTAYNEFVQRGKNLPPIIERVMKKAVKDIEESREKPIVAANPEKYSDKFLNGSIKTTVSRNENGAGGVLETQVDVGRQFWLFGQYNLLENAAKRLLEHEWIIFRPFKGQEWLTSDHPVVRLNYYENGSYDLRGGWGVENGNIVMPLSPNHLLFTQIGSREVPPTKELPLTTTNFFQRLIVERAYKWIYASKPPKYIYMLRKRVVDKVAYENEIKNQNEWHKVQSKS
jgi:hypothetical protein